MNQIISFVFSVFILIFAIIIIFEIHKTNSSEIDKISIQDEIKLLTNKVDNYCLDPFIESQFVIKHNKDLTVYSKENKICGNSSNYLYCEKTKCDLSEKEIFKKENLDFKYYCNLTKNNSLIEINCEN